MKYYYKVLWELFSSSIQPLLLPLSSVKVANSLLVMFKDQESSSFKRAGVACSKINSLRVESYRDPKGDVRFSTAKKLHISCL